MYTYLLWSVYGFGGANTLCLATDSLKSVIVLFISMATCMVGGADKLDEGLNVKEHLVGIFVFPMSSILNFHLRRITNVNLNCWATNHIIVTE